MPTIMCILVALQQNIFYRQVNAILVSSVMETVKLPDAPMPKGKNTHTAERSGAERSGAARRGAGRRGAASSL